MLFFNTVFVFAVTLAVSAQSTTSPANPTPSISACILQCTQQGLTVSNCTSVTDIPCFCSSTAFQNATAGCLMQNCTQADVQSALQLQQQECAGLNSTSSTATSPAGYSTPVSGSGTSKPASSSTTKPSATPAAGAASVVKAGFGAVLGAVIASLLAL